MKKLIVTIIIKNTKMINFNDATNENIKEHNLNCPQILDHLYRILIIGGSGSRKANLLFNLISHQPDIDQIYLNAKDPYEAKYRLQIKYRIKAFK